LEACPQCGLLVARWEGFHLEVPSLEPVDRAWAELEANWSDESAHKRFLELAAHVDGLDVAAALYKRRNLAQPDDPRAREGLARSVTLAQNLYSAKARDSIAASYERIRRGILVFAAVLTATIAVWLFIVVLRRR
jgi:hypothetical protein